RLRRGAELAPGGRHEGEAERRPPTLVGLEIGAPVIIGEPGDEGRPLAHDPAVRLAEPAERIAADLPERRIRAGDGQLVFAVTDADEALRGDVVAAGIGQLFVVEFHDGPARLVVSVPA